MHAPSAWVQWTPTPEPTHPLPSPQTGLSSPTACANGRGVLLPTPTAQNASKRLKNALHVKLVDDRFQDLRNGPRFSQLIPVCRANRHCIFSRDQATCLRVTRLKVQDSITLLDHVGGSIARNVVACDNLCRFHAVNRRHLVPHFHGELRLLPVTDLLLINVRHRPVDLRVRLVLTPVFHECTPHLQACNHCKKPPCVYSVLA